MEVEENSKGGKEKQATRDGKREEREVLKLAGEELQTREQLRWAIKEQKKHHRTTRKEGENTEKGKEKGCR